MYWKGVLFAASGGDKVGTLSVDQFTTCWRSLAKGNYDEASQFVHILTRYV